MIDQTKKWGLSEEKPPPHELDLFDRYAKGNPQGDDSYSKGWLWAQKLLYLTKRKERREGWEEGAEAVTEWFASGAHASNIDPPSNPYEEEPS